MVTTRDTTRRSLLSALFHFYFYRFLRPPDASIRFRFPAPKKKEKQKEKKKEKKSLLVIVTSQSFFSRLDRSSRPLRRRSIHHGDGNGNGKMTAVFGPLVNLPQQKHNILFVLDWGMILVCPDRWGMGEGEGDDVESYR
jgi:hypothetical protein